MKFEREISRVLRGSSLNLSYIKKTFERKITIGYVRKFLVDSIVCRTRNPDLVIVNNDIDLEYISEDYLQEIFIRFGMEPDAVSYRLGDIPMWSEKHVTFYWLLNFYRSIDNEYNKLRNRALPIRVSNHNLVFSAYMYVRTGGYASGVKVAEDLTFSFDVCHVFSKKVFWRSNERVIPEIRRVIHA